MKLDDDKRYFIQVFNENDWNKLIKYLYSLGFRWNGGFSVDYEKEHNVLFINVDGTQQLTYDSEKYFRKHYNDRLYSYDEFMHELTISDKLEEALKIIYHD